MKTPKINSTNFRLPIKSLRKPSGTRSTLVREYSNPNAKELFKQAMATDNFNKKMKLLNAMGNYKVIDIEIENNLKNLPH